MSPCHRVFVFVFASGASPPLGQVMVRVVVVVVVLLEQFSPFTPNLTFEQV